MNEGLQVNPWMTLLVICFALSSWIDMAGFWVEIPILVHILPEGWTLPSYIVLATNTAILSPLVYTVINTVWPGNTHRREVTMVFVIISIGLLSLVLLTFFWQHTVWVAGAERSLPVLVLVLFLCIVDTTSCVVYMPYMARFSEHYMPVYIAGEEMGGLITGIVGLIQGAGSEPNCYNETRFLTNATSGENYTETVLEVNMKTPLFSPTVFFVFLAFVMLVSMISFTILNFSTFAKREMMRGQMNLIANKNDKCKPHNTFRETKLDFDETAKSEQVVFIRKNESALVQCSTDKVEKTMESKRFYICCMIYMFGACLVYSIFLSIQSYSTLPYGALAYTLAVRLGSVANPLAAFAASFIPVRSLRMLCALMVFTTALTGYHVVLAAQSPSPPLQHDVIGSVLVIVTGPLVTASFAYIRACIAAVLHAEGGHKALFYAGACLQLGACIGGVISFVLVNVLNLFVSIPTCV